MEDGGDDPACSCPAHRVVDRRPGGAWGKRLRIQRHHCSYNPQLKTRSDYLSNFLDYTSPFFRNTLSTAGNCMTSSERPSPEQLLKKEASPAVLRGRELWKCSGGFKCLEFPGLGGSQPYSRGEFQEKLWECFRGLSGFFRNFLRKVPAVLGVWPNFVFQIN